MKRFFSMMTTALFVSILALPSVVSAESAIDKAINQVTTFAGGSGLETKGDPASIVGQFVNAAVGVLGVVAVALIVYAGGLWITAAGDEGKVEKAKELIKNTVIGMIVLGMAYAITIFIVSFVTS